MIEHLLGWAQCAPEAPIPRVKARTFGGLTALYYHAEHLDHRERLRLQVRCFEACDPFLPSVNGPIKRPSQDQLNELRAGLTAVKGCGQLSMVYAPVPVIPSTLSGRSYLRARHENAEARARILASLGELAELLPHSAASLREIPLGMRLDLLLPRIPVAELRSAIAEAAAKCHTHLDASAFTVSGLWPPMQFLSGARHGK